MSVKNGARIGWNFIDCEKTLCKKICLHTSYVILNILLLIPNIIILVLIFPLVYVTQLLFYHTRTACSAPDDEFQTTSPLTATEVYLFRSQPANNICCFTFSRSMTVEKLKDSMHERIFGESSEKLDAFRRLTQTVSRVNCSCNSYHWISYKRFSLDDHIELVEDVFSEKDFYEFLLQKYLSALNITLPLWKIYVIPKFGVQQDTLVVLQIHSVISDGVSIIELLQEHLCDPLPRKIAPIDTFGYTAFLNSSLLSLFWAPSLICQALRRKNGKRIFLKRIWQKPLKTSARKTSTSFASSANGSVIAQRSVDSDIPLDSIISPEERQVEYCQLAVAEPISTNIVQKLRLVTKATINDIYLSCISGALQKHLDRVNISGDIHCAIPVSLRRNSSSTSLGQEFSIIAAALPLTREGMIPRLWKTKRTMKNSKRNCEISFFGGIFHILSALLPTRLVNRLCNHIYSKNFCQFCNVSASPILLSVKGSLLKSISFWMWPLACGDVSLCFNLISYADTFYLSAASKSDLPINCQELCNDINSQILQLKDLVQSRNVPPSSLKKIQDIIREKSEIAAEMAHLRRLAVEKEKGENPPPPCSSDPDGRGISRSSSGAFSGLMAGHATTTINVDVNEINFSEES